MGTKQAKVEVPFDSERDHQNSEMNCLNPRSPNANRTPISAPEQKEKLQIAQQHSMENPLSILRKHIFKGFGYNLQDPRSPSMRLNRTPLIFEDTNDKGFSLDDTFADLFVDSRIYPNQESEKVQILTEVKTTEGMQLDGAACSLQSQHSSGTVNASSSLNANSFAVLEEETMPCPVRLNQTPIDLQQQIDPRSPTIGVDRTPIIFNDDENEEAMLENILATLSLNISSSNSVASVNGTMSPADIQKQPIDSNVAISNKHLERVCKSVSRQPVRIPRKLNHRRQQEIYEDCENACTSNLQNSTPKKRTCIKNKGGQSPYVRTPLSCVKNRPNFRSRSVGSSSKSIKTRLALPEFNDNTNTINEKSYTRGICLEN